MKASLIALVSGATCWILAAVALFAVGNTTWLILWIDALAFILLGLGVWAVHAGQGAAALVRPDRSAQKRLWPKGPVSLVGALLATVGFFAMAVPPIIVARASEFGMPSELGLGEVIGGNSVFAIAAIAWALGRMVLGVALLRSGRFPTWAAVALIVCPPVATALFQTDGPIVIASIVAVIEALAWITIGLRILPSPRPVLVGEMIR